MDRHDLDTYHRERERQSERAYQFIQARAEIETARRNLSYLSTWLDTLERRAHDEGHPHPQQILTTAQNINRGLGAIARTAKP